VCAPILVALVDLGRPRWYPTYDWAWIELLVRDVTSSHPPLVGLPGRFVHAGERGGHPGPMMFYALAPIYRLLGSSSFSLLAATAALSAGAVVTSLWLASRRGAVRGTVLVAAALALLVHAYGTHLLVVPWNPWLPMLWWVAFLLAAWCVLCDDLPMLPVLAATGTFCAQTHLPYLGNVAGVSVVVVGILVVRLARTDDRDRLRAAGRWAAIAVAIGAVLWLPVLVDEVVNDPGNLSIIAGSLTADDAVPALGIGEAVDTWLTQLDPLLLVRGDQRVAGSPLVGVVVLLAWLVAAIAAVRLRATALVHLHVVVGAALATGLVSTTRIIGDRLGYLVLWSWGTAALLLVAVVATASLAADRRWPGRREVLLGALAAIVVAFGVASAADDNRADRPLAGLDFTMARLVPALVADLEADARYAIEWAPDTMPAFVAPSGLVLELSRAGIDAVMTPDRRVSHPIGRHRIAPASETTATLFIVIGADEIARWAARPDATELVRADARPGDDVALTARRADATRRLAALGLDDLVGLLAFDPWTVALDERVPGDLAADVDALLELTEPAAVFSVPTAP
jgi:hypothetical protein